MQNSGDAQATVSARRGAVALAIAAPANQVVPLNSTVVVVASSIPRQNDADARDRVASSSPASPVATGAVQRLQLK